MQEMSDELKKIVAYRRRSINMRCVNAMRREKVKTILELMHVLNDGSIIDYISNVENFKRVSEAQRCREYHLSSLFASADYEKIIGGFNSYTAKIVAREIFDKNINAQKLCEFSHKKTSNIKASEVVEILQVYKDDFKEYVSEITYLF